MAPDEEACRQARLEFFERVAAATGLRTLALAHTADDQVETFLLRLLRGAGPTGLTGILADRQIGQVRVIRPMLHVSRAEVLQYLRDCALPSCQDASNADCRFTRNRIRHELLPLLERDFNPGIRAVLLRTAEIFRDEDALLAEWVAKYQHVETLSVVQLMQLPTALQRRAIRAWLGEISFEEVESVRQLATAESPSGAVSGLMYREYDLLRKAPGQCGGAVAGPWVLVVPGATAVRELGGRFVVELTDVAVLSSQPERQDADFASRSQEAFDAGALGAAPFVRTWQDGDRFQPLGMAGEKKLQDFFVDEKVPRRQRGRVPLLCGTDGRIAWVVGYRIAEPFKVTAQTNRRVTVRFEG